MNSKNYSIYLLVFLSVGFSCTDKNADTCDFRLENFGDEVKAPFLRKVDSVKTDLCKFRGDFWLDGKYYLLTGRFKKKGNGILLAFDSLVTNDVRYFDFDTKEGNSYDVKFNLRGGKSVIQRVRVDKIYPIIRNGKNSDAFLFRVFDGFDYDENVRSDIVYFVTMESAVIGSYVVEEGELDWVILSGGDILRDKIDYSKKTFGVIE